MSLNKETKLLYSSGTSLSSLLFSGYNIVAFLLIYNIVAFLLIYNIVAFLLIYKYETSVNLKQLGQ